MPPESSSTPAQPNTAPPTSATPQTNPLAAGASTTEGFLAHVVVFLSSTIAALGTITTLLGSLTTILPPAAGDLGKYLALGGAAVAGLTQIAYGAQRSLIKIEAIRAGTANADSKTPDDAAAALGGVTP